MADHWGHIDDLGRGRLRWSAGFMLVAGLFAGGTWLAICWTRNITPPAAPSPAEIIITLAPLPAAPVTPPDAAPPGLKQTIAQSPPAPEVRQTLPKAPPAPAPEVAVPVSAKPKPVRHHQPIEQRPSLKHIPDKTPPAQETTAPPQMQAAPAPAAAPPAPVTSSAASSNAVPSWQGQLMQRLEAFKRYPPLAQLRNEQGVAYLRFSMDRNGKVLSASIVKSAGYDELDEETLELIHRAEPLPKPPPEVPGDPLMLTVPIQFFLGSRN